ncbi:SMI1/KNR4 family protein [Bremerella sp. T1]|uniref:SMI1/KNR4 family protein n=1 Tax=Bremerella sp. TYQ1 TaxID=3119568 RepID=UPI001CCAC26E|nr:SMI1/KNR4 family protein [Bremerella volcania]UBM36811.1 SMI1/KNR4 family protein [Bremerella volcania]
MYESNSFAGPFNESEFAAFKNWLVDCRGEKFRFDEDYVEHLRIHHGGRAKRKYFRTQNGVLHVVGRFLNFADDSHPLAEYNVEATWSQLSDRMGDYLIPFAELFGGDFLCFNHHYYPPSIVVWYHDRSIPEEEPYCEAVTSRFGELLELLTDDE